MNAGRLSIRISAVRFPDCQSFCRGRLQTDTDKYKHPNPPNALFCLFFLPLFALPVFLTAFHLYTAFYVFFLNSGSVLFCSWFPFPRTPDCIIDVNPPDCNKNLPEASKAVSVLQMLREIFRLSSGFK